MPRRALRLTPCLLALAGLAAPHAAFAAPSSRLVYARGAGAETCPDESALRQAVTSRVGYDPFFPWAPLTVTVELTREGGHLRGRVVLVDDKGMEKGAQTLESADATCEDLLASVALAVSVALDAVPPPASPHEDPPAAPEKTEASPPAPAPSAPALLPVAKKDAPATQPATSPASHGVSLWLAAHGRISAGAWSTAAVGPALSLEARLDHLGLALEGRYDVASAVAVGPSAQATVSRATGSLLPCAHFAWFAACGLATVGETWARGDLAAPKTDSAPYAAFGARVGVDVPLVSKLRLLGTADVVGVATRTNIAVEGGSSPVANGPVELSGGVALLAPIF
jgi:hypothetical protein